MAFLLLAPTHLYLASLQKLQKSLLNRFTAYITLIGVLFLGQLVNLINKDNTGSLFLSLGKQVSDFGSAHTHKHFHEFGTGHGEKGHISFSCHIRKPDPL